MRVQDQRRQMLLPFCLSPAAMRVREKLPEKCWLTACPFVLSWTPVSPLIEEDYRKLFVYRYPLSKTSVVLQNYSKEIIQTIGTGHGDIQGQQCLHHVSRGKENVVGVTAAKCRDLFPHVGVSPSVVGIVQTLGQEWYFRQNVFIYENKQ